MLRFSKKSHSNLKDNKKRHSSFFDLNSFDTNNVENGNKNSKNESKKGSKNEKAVFVNNLQQYSKQDSSVQQKNMQHERETANSILREPKEKSNSKTKRQSTILDENIVKDYHLAIKHFNMEDEKRTSLEYKISNEKHSKSGSVDSNFSSATMDSNMSSLFSSSATVSLRDFLYEEFETNKFLSKTHQTYNNDNCNSVTGKKAFLEIPDDRHKSAKWRKITDKEKNKIHSESNIDHFDYHRRTELEF
ncbi:hypothetical protein TPHA_0M01220 [Tetrapisispora phaffii CBS 4417]|uniref:Uncharacterized protein n=1 Tax=Tetrapisispora phaffii (strain ATCC 24235 / CBS 4417 / NBRC 1672 / NRRL Y-8282 / UCD 70-5) TaxID=1071381 RepID=G8C0I2_TETPH|nr:hypothetical protein TPHA_0M01220 [Tetrapisispora phaffii CBS 4417]CCE65697.1 hypothetical protein TPHA_0M01220 [Tetrapisispora phaffii CBS 4417]